jgi:hypothetical protein
MRIVMSYVLILTAVLFVGCKKDKVASATTNLDGSYVGEFAYSASGATIYAPPISGRLTINMSVNKYTATSPINFPASAAGHFTINNNQIAYTDSTVHTANFDWGLILNGTYTYSTKGDSLFLTKKSSFSTYAYKLVKTTDVDIQ